MYIRCHPKEDDFCISGVFQNDDIHNCPPPYSSDEPKLAQQTDQFQQYNQNQNQNQPNTDYEHREVIKTSNGVNKNSIQISLFYLSTMIAFAQIF